MIPELHRPWFSHYEPSVPRTVTVFDQPLYSLLDEAAARYPKRPALIFQNTRLSYKALHEAAERFAGALRRAGIRADCLHGDIKQATREKTMADFRHGKLPVLIATDVASRGIDVDDVDGVINYDVPEENEYYIHRIGRTGRARKKGISFTLLGSFPEKAKLDEIAKFAGFHIVPMIFDEYGCLVPAPAEEKHPTSRRRF